MTSASSVAQMLKGAVSQVANSGAGDSQSRESEVDAALGGSYLDGKAPALLKGMNHFVNKSPEMFGKKHISHILGMGDVPVEGDTPHGVFVSVNLRDKKSFSHVPVEIKEELLNLKKELHNAHLLRQILVHKHAMPVAIQDTRYFKEMCLPKLKAFSLADFSAWVPTLNASFYFEELDLTPLLERYFETYPMASKTITVPGAITRLKGRLQVDSDTFTAQYNTSSSYSLAAQDCVTHTDITEDLMQDMVPNAGGFERLRREVALGIQRSKESALINGDDTITSSVQGDGHQDSDIAGGAATLFDKAFKGLRKRALAASQVYDNGGNGVSLGTYNGLIPVLGKFAAREKSDLLIIVGPTIANKVVAGGVPEILTAQNFGLNQATLLTGNLPPVFGIEQYCSEWVREDVNSSGVYASAQVLTTILIVKKSRFVIGQRAPMRIWATPSLASSDKLLMSAKERFTFGGVPQATTETTVGIAYNLALT